MLSELELQSLPSYQALDEYGRHLVHEVHSRGGAPVRAVRSSGSNVIQQYMSLKMDRVYLCESHTVEAPFALQLEYDPSTLAYYLQPCTLDILIHDDFRNRHQRRQHTPDVLVIRYDGIELWELKPVARLRKLTKRSPDTWTEGPEGVFRRRDVEEHLKGTGIGYRVRSDLEINQILVENLRDIADFTLPTAPKIDPERLSHLRAVLQKNGFITIADLVQRYDFTGDEIRKAIADRLVAFDFENDRLGDPVRARVFPDEVALEIFKLSTEALPPDGWYATPQSLSEGAVISLDGTRYRISYLIDTEAVLENEAGAQKTLQLHILHKFQNDSRLKVIHQDSCSERGVRCSIADFTEEEREIAFARLRIVQGEKIPGWAPSPSTVGRWKARIRDIDPHDRPSMIRALVPRHRDKGNRKRRLPDEVIEIMHQVIDTKYYNARNRSKRSCYEILVAECIKDGLTPPSEPVFLKAIDEQCTQLAITKRSGKRLANKEESLANFLYRDDPPDRYIGSPHGSRPFEAVHIDHTQCDLELVCIETGRNLGKPWLTIAIDAYSRQILGFYLSYSPASRVSSFMVLRDMVRRFNRLPETVVVDRGSDLTSRDFRSITVMFGVSIKWRPGQKPRVGGVIERLFGIANKRLFHNLEGNTQIMRKARESTKSVDPKRHAKWYLEALYTALEKWLFQHYANTEHPAVLRPPSEAFETGITMSGSRTHIHIPLDRTFKILTCPTVSREGVRTVSKGRGIRLNGDFYYHPELDRPAHWQSKVPVKYDPWDVRVCYAYIDNHWIECRSVHFQRLANFTPALLRAFSQELIRRKTFSRAEVTPRKLVEHIASAEFDTFPDALRQKAMASRAVYGPIGMTSVTPEEELASDTPFPMPKIDYSAWLPNQTPEEDDQDDFSYDIFPD
ncbi:DDE-type integrase/transposase/recombinase [Parvibaculum sp.]|uniref:DDE-type integrase/transposase/recombinase n=1 Tax=Parvibaculum sp. TaxID=2024848 RepID=UPI000C972204|nr:DDE-type integrase/transposase/recombinase [Parvibaculum sp.]MAB13924.1 hypothetical protein [Parvibaculum sp.]